MLFNSLIFLLFFCCFFALWPWAKQTDQRRWWWIIIASFIFYGYWDWRFLGLILLSGSIDYVAALRMQEAPQQRKFWLWVSLLGNLGGLAFFKYSGFIAETLEALGSYWGWSLELKAQLPAFSLVVPVGISFYTFQSMSYTIDVYRGELQATRQVGHFFAYLSMFPQLVAGPIVRAQHLLKQLAEDRPVSWGSAWLGFRLMVYGFFQKMVLADNLAPLVNKAFWGIDTQATFLYWWLVMLAFAFQIYFDFAGYSTIARGLAKLMGYQFKVNFNHPYRATSLREFWQRWHLSLSTWFRDYVYIPLGGNQGGKGRLHLNLWLTMLLSGLWHGAAGHFVLWGAVHAAFLSLERLTRWPKRLKQLPLGRFLAWLLVGLQVLIAWVFFRATSTQQAFDILQNMRHLTLEGANLIVVDYFDALCYLLLAILVECWYVLKQNHPALRGLRRNNTYEMFSTALLIVACIYFRGPAAEFIYFQF